MSWAVSPTQVADWRLCPRKFLWKYVVGLKPPPGESRAKGTACHQVLETWLNGLETSDATLEVEGFVFDTSEIEALVRPALQHFPEPGYCTTEEKVRFEWRGVLWTGRIDAADEKVVYDLKSTKATKWIKTPIELATDPQALLYGRAKDTRRVKFVYVLTTGKPRAVPVETLIVGPGPVEDLLVQDAKDILDAVAKAYHPLAVEPGPPEACEAFGGCDYRSNCTDLRCGLLGRRGGTKTAGLIQLGRQDHMGMKDMLKAKLQQSVQDATPAPAEVPTAEAVAINPPEVADAGPPPLPPPPKQPAAPKRGRPKKSADPATVTSDTSAPVAAPPASPEPTAQPPAMVGKLGIRTLYVNCQSDAHPETIDLAKVMAEAHEYTCQKCNVNHWYELPFSEGKACMAAFALEILRQHPDSAQGRLRVRCSSYLPETALVLGELQAAAAEVVR